jgi:hypothetical protein
MNHFLLKKANVQNSAVDLLASIGKRDSIGTGLFDELSSHPSEMLISNFILLVRQGLALSNCPTINREYFWPLVARSERVFL